MALSSGLIRRLSCDTGDEPLAKRLKLAENVFYSPDLPIVRKEECIFRWLTNELSSENIEAIWTTIHRCLTLDPKSFLRLSPETKNILTEKLIEAFTEYPQVQVLDEMLKCCAYVFSSVNIHNYSKDNNIVRLLESVLRFTSQILSDDTGKYINTNLALDCTEKAMISFAQICRQNFSEKKNFTLIFVEKIFFPLGSLVKTLKHQKISSKIFIETEKCIKRLLLVAIKNVSSTCEKTDETDYLFDILKDKASSEELKDVIAAFECLFECAVNTFQQNAVLVDTILRKLVNCVEQKDRRKHVLVCLLENSVDVSFNFDNTVDEVTLKVFLKTQVEEVVTKKKTLKMVDYELITVIAKLNPLIIEDLTQNIVERVLFEKRKGEKEEVAYENLVKELWKASVRLRRQHKFLSKFLITVNSFKDKEFEFLQFHLPKLFLSEFGEELKNKTTNAQVLGMFHTLNFHLKSDCLEKLQTPDITAHSYLFFRVVSRFYISFFENCNFLDGSLPAEWQTKFSQAFTDMSNHLASLTEILCTLSNEHKIMIFPSYSDLIKIWCEVYDLLRYYMADVIPEGLNSPVDESQLKELKHNIKKVEGSKIHEVLLDQIVLFKSVIYERDNPKPVRDKVVSNLWPEILENHFEIIETLSEVQILKLAENFVTEMISAQDDLDKWILILKRNTPRMTKKFATAVAFKIISNIVKDAESCSTKSIVEKIDFEKILQTIDDLEQNAKVYKSAKKEISKQNFNTVKQLDIEKTKNNLLLLSKLPLAFFDENARTFLFLVLYTFQEETKTVINLESCTVKLYSDILRQNDIDVLHNVSKPSIVIKYFKDNPTILSKMFKLSLSRLPTSAFWNDYVDGDECTRKIKCILLNCADNLRSKASSEHKTFLHDLSLKLCDKLAKELADEIYDPDEIAGLRICLKILFSEKKKIKSNLKKCTDLTLKKIFENNEDIIEHGSIVESLHLSSVVLSHRENFELSGDIVKKLCIVLINNPETKIFSHFMEILKDDEFEFFAKSLSNQTKESLINGDLQILQKLVTIWESLSKAEAKGIRSKTLYTSVNNLLNDLLASEIKGTSSEFTLKICRAFVTSKRMIRLSEKIIDSILVISMQSLQNLNHETKLIACQEALKLCSDFVRSRTDFILDRLPVLNDFFRKIFQIILQEAKETDFADEQMLRILAIDIEKYCTFFAKLKKDVSRISPYLIADLIEVTSSTGVLPSYLKISFESSMCQLLSNCDRHAISFLSRTLPAATQQVFKTIYDNYTKYHKFTGKI